MTRKKTKEERQRLHRDYMSSYRQANRERIRAQHNSYRGIIPDVFILNSF